VTGTAFTDGEKNVIAKISKICWILFLVTLPFTSFPFFPGNIGGGTLVRPLSIYPLILLLALVILPRLFTKPLPKTVLALLPFIIIAVASTLLAFLQGIENLQGVSVISRMLRGLVTLGVGTMIYLAVTIWPIKKEDLNSSLRWLYVGFIAALSWGTLQAIYVIRFSPRWFDLMSAAQRYFSTRRLFTNRVSGLTYEPNWFASSERLRWRPRRISSWSSAR